jgi:protein-tyrosine phosphatase
MADGVPSRSVIDLHSHLLPAIDDGPSRMKDSVEMARVAVEAGTTTMVCTPHILGRKPPTPEKIADGVDSLRAELARAEISLDIVTGAEIDLDALERLDDETLRALTFGGNGTWLLLEMPFRRWPTDLGAILDDLEVRGFRAVLAHPERAAAVQRQPDRLKEAVGRGALCQLTASSFTGDHGADAERTAEQLLALGWAHLLASDAHSATWRPPGLLQGLAAASAHLGCGAGELSWMVREGPALVLAGEDARPPRLSAARPEAAVGRRGRRVLRPGRSSPSNPRRR